jgi:Lipocalin-like domain
LFLDAAGHYSVVIVTGGDARSVGYFGTYTLDEANKTLTLHVVAGTRPNAAGRDETRVVTLNGNQLVLQRPPSPGPAAMIGTVKVTWQRAE